MKKCSADTPVREKPRSATGFRIGSFETLGSFETNGLRTNGGSESARLQPGRERTQSWALAPEGGCFQ